MMFFSHFIYCTIHVALPELVRYFTTDCLSIGEVHPVRDTQRRPRPHALPLNGRLGDVPILAALPDQGVEIYICDALTGNLNLVVRQDTMQQPAQTSGYYAASPTSTSSNPGHPRTPDGTVDIELEVRVRVMPLYRQPSVRHEINPIFEDYFLIFFAFFQRCATTRSIPPSGSPRPSRRLSLPS